MPTLSGDYTTSNESGYTEYTVSSGSKLIVEMGEGETFENALIDVTASGAGVNIFTFPDRFDVHSPIDSCAIRNVGIRGQVPTGNGFIFLVGVTGSAVIEGIYLGDGEPGTSPHDGPGAFFGFENHLGRMDLRNIYIAGFSDNAFYLPGRPGNRTGTYDGSGTFHWEECFVTDCEISAYRVNDQPGTHTMTDCHANVNGNSSRAIWNWESTMDVDNCQLIGGSNGGVIGDGHVNFGENVAVDGAVTVSYSGSFTRGAAPQVPDATPTTALEAATGDVDGSPSDPGDDDDRVDLDNYLLISGEQRGTSDAAEYTLRTTGPIAAGDYRDPEFEDSDIVEHDTYYEVTWSILDWRDSWEFAGELFYVDVEDDDVVFELNGQQIDPNSDQYSQDPPEPDDPEPPDDRPDRDPDFSTTVPVAAGETETIEFEVNTSE